MDLPRIASQLSICQQQQQSTARRLLQQQLQQQQEPQFVVLPSAASYQPSRKKEEAAALSNLKKRLQSVEDANGNSKGEENGVRRKDTEDGDGTEDVGKPLLLQKILNNRPVSMVLDVSDLRTAWQDSDFITDCLCWHNVYRQRHSSPVLTMSSELCYLAQTWANHLAHTNKFYYRNDRDIGQNLFCRQSSVITTDLTGQEVATYWYSAFRHYDYTKEPDVLHVNVNTGPFTQLIWASTRHFGIGKARSRSGKIVVVAHYYPVGNVSGVFQYNVFPPRLEYANLPHSNRFQQLHSSGSGTTSGSISSNTVSST